MTRLALAVLWLGGAIGSGCFIEAAPAPAVQAPPPPPPAVAPAQPEYRRVLEVSVESSSPTGIEAGYQYCCGNDSYRLDIGCGYLDMRCYVRQGDGWVRTYGRHCKDNLGSACYLNGCDDRCQ